VELFLYFPPVRRHSVDRQRLPSTVTLIKHGRTNVTDTNGGSMSDVTYSDGMLLYTLMLVTCVIQGGAEAS
jgi:hypothetical protein